MAEVRELVGVYDADGTVWGELSYFVGARLGRAHCSLCDITHGRVREKAEWRTACSELPVAFETVHRDEVDADVALALADLPAVLARTTDGVVPLLGPHDLSACAGDPSELVAAVVAAMAAGGLAWPDASAVG